MQVATTNLCVKYQSADCKKALAWSLTSVAAVLTSGRLWLRWRKSKTLRLDDNLNGLALLALLGSMATLSAYMPIFYSAVYYDMGLNNSPPSDNQQIVEGQLSLASKMQFWVTIYAVKGSFLGTYYHVFKISGNFRKAWWFAAACTGCSFLATFLSPLWYCGSPSQLLNLEACAETPVQFFITLEIFWFILNVSSDILLISLPMAMVRGLKLPKSQKIGLGAIFAIVALDVLFDCLRTVYALTDYLGTYYDAGFAWDICEATFAVIICALPPYRSVLFPSQSKRPAVSYSSPQRGPVQTYTPPSPKRQQHNQDIELDSIHVEHATHSYV